LILAHIEAAAGLSAEAFRAIRRAKRHALNAVVRCDMQLQSVLLGWMRVLTKPCVCPQVLHGSMRLMGGPEVGATVRGMKPSR